FDSGVWGDGALGPPRSGVAMAQTEHLPIYKASYDPPGAGGGEVRPHASVRARGGASGARSARTARSKLIRVHFRPRLMRRGARRSLPPPVPVRSDMDRALRRVERPALRARIARVAGS